jgi:hypothetical protein
MANLITIPGIRHVDGRAILVIESSRIVREVLPETGD